MKIFIGKVVGLKNLKTATVEVSRVITHPIYKKKMATSRKYQVHDEAGVKLGDTVKFTASKPYSKTKRWKIVTEKGKAK